MKISQVVLPAAEQIMRFLNSQPNDEVFSTVEVEAKVNLSTSSNGGRLRRQLAQYWLKPVKNQSALWGNPRAIVALKKHLETL